MAKNPAALGPTVPIDTAEAAPTESELQQRYDKKARGAPRRALSTKAHA